jgi:hypothetical protein
MPVQAYELFADRLRMILERHLHIGLTAQS